MYILDTGSEVFAVSLRKSQSLKLCSVIYLHIDSSVQSWNLNPKSKFYE